MTRRMRSLRPFAVMLLAGMGTGSFDAGAAEQPPAAPLCGKGALDILLTNDDGYEAAGIRALYVQLRKAGHRVLLVAPARNASGSSSSFTWTPVEVTRDPADPNVIGVAATPATAVVLAATALYPPGQRPDLVISGINDGNNTGSLLVLSGTVGAALAGTLLLDPPVPGIAVNANRPATPEARAALPAGHLDQVALHLTRLLEAARGWFCDRGQLVRAAVVLNVNYPALPVADMRGVSLARQGRTSDLHLTFEGSGADTYVARRATEAPRPDARDSDVTLLAGGYVTVTPIDANLDGRNVPLDDLQRRLHTLSR
jgi:5'-nucleotidase